MNKIDFQFSFKMTTTEEKNEKNNSTQKHWIILIMLCLMIGYLWIEPDKAKALNDTIQVLANYLL